MNTTYSPEAGFDNSPEGIAQARLGDVFRATTNILAVLPASRIPEPVQGDDATVSTEQIRGAVIVDTVTTTDHAGMARAAIEEALTA